jgi:hypothetical protein
VGENLGEQPNECACRAHAGTRGRGRLPRTRRQNFCPFSQRIQRVQCDCESVGATLRWFESSPLHQPQATEIKGKTDKAATFASVPATILPFFCPFSALAVHVPFWLRFRHVERCSPSWSDSRLCSGSSRGNFTLWYRQRTAALGADVRLVSCHGSGTGTSVGRSRANGHVPARSCRRT